MSGPINGTAPVSSPPAPQECNKVDEKILVAPMRYVYSCRACRRALFTDEEIVPHCTDRDASGNKNFRGHRADREERATECTSYFLDPDVSPWVAAESLEGVADVAPDTIYCPDVRCRAKIGTQSWTGAQCSCGAWITPSFKILAKCVDKLPAPQ